MQTGSERGGSDEYRGRLAPSPTGYLHLGHARTFWMAWTRARKSGGKLVLRNEDLDPDRSRPEFARAMCEDLRWLGLDWDEGPDCGGPFGPYIQSQRREMYAAALDELWRKGFIYPCTCSRKDVLRALAAPHQGEDEPVYPGTCRPAPGEIPHSPPGEPTPGSRTNWRFRVPQGQEVMFTDGRYGRQAFTAGFDFGDFVVCRQDGVAAYHLAVVVDDALMRITEVVRGADLLASTARQLLLFDALGHYPPAFFHCPLMTDAAGVRLAKRTDALSLRALRNQGVNPATIREQFARELA